MAFGKNEASLRYLEIRKQNRQFAAITLDNVLEYMIMTLSYSLSGNDDSVEKISTEWMAPFCTNL